MRFLFVTGALAIAAVAVAPSIVHAEGLAFRLGAGPAVADRFGASGLAALQFSHASGLLLRADARGFMTGRSADWNNSARLVSFGGGAGIMSGGEAGVGSRGRYYALASAGSGVDLRENDTMTTVGAAVGLDGLGSPNIFGEIRYEHWFQHEPHEHKLPSNMITAVVGIVIG